MKVTSKIFQQILNEDLEGLKGVLCIADELLICSENDSQHDSMKIGWQESKTQSLQMGILITWNDVQWSHNILTQPEAWYKYNQSHHQNEHPV